MRKLSEQTELHGTMLAAAGMKRLGYSIGNDGLLSGPEVPEGIYVLPIDVEQIVPAVGQAAIGIEPRTGDAEIDEVCGALNHESTWHCITAERGFLNGMGGGCQSPVAAHATISEGKLSIAAVSFQTGSWNHHVGSGDPSEADSIGRSVASVVDAPKLA